MSLSIGLLSGYAGWLLDHESSLLLVADSANQAQQAATRLMRMGYDRIEGFLEAPFPAHAASGRAFSSIQAVDAQTVRKRLDDSANWRLLDVRKNEECAQAHIDGAEHRFLGCLAEQLDDLDTEATYTTLCASGARATVAASLLARAGFQVDVFLGAMQAWQAAGFEVVGAD